jgi:RNA polymerase sigma-70 factor (ECF subfamily)
MMMTRETGKVCDTFTPSANSRVEMTTRIRLLGKAMNQTAEVDWQAVYTDLLPRVYSFFRYRVPDRATAEDLTATTLERAWSKRARYRTDFASFSTWVFGIARHVALGYYRQHRSEIPLDTLDDQASDSSAEESFERLGDRERLFALLRRLPTREQELLALKYGAELTNREIARVTGLSESNVGTILSRVIQKMRADWEQKL